MNSSDLILLFKICLCIFVAGVWALFEFNDASVIEEFHPVGLGFQKNAITCSQDFDRNRFKLVGKERYFDRSGDDVQEFLDLGNF